MQMRCHKCNNFFTVTSASKLCPDCEDGKSVKKVHEHLDELHTQIEFVDGVYRRIKENEAHLYFRKQCVSCGEIFFTKKKMKITCSLACASKREANRCVLYQKKKSKDL